MLQAVWTRTASAATASWEPSGVWMWHAVIYHWVVGVWTGRGSVALGDSSSDVKKSACSAGSA